MINGGIALVGLPSVGLHKLEAEFGFTHSEVTQIRGVFDNLDKPREIPPQRLLQMLTESIAGKDISGMLLIYKTPWVFLGERIRKSGGAKKADTIEGYARHALAFWHVYHDAILQLHRKFGKRSILINGDRPLHVEVIKNLVADRFQVQAEVIPVNHVAGDDDANHDEAMIPAVEALAPECLELYAGLEACAELMGREPEFGIDGFMQWKTNMTETATRKGNLKNISASQLTEDGLYLLQICQLQDELKHYYRLNKQKDKAIAELKRQLSEPMSQKLGHAMAGYAQRLTGWAGGKKWSLSRQGALLRASDLFDAQWYLKSYPDVVQAGLDPVEHYLKFGATEGRNPGPSFETRWYLATYPDVATGGMNPLVHYIRFGRAEGRSPARSPG